MPRSLHQSTPTFHGDRIRLRPREVLRLREIASNDICRVFAIAPATTEKLLTLGLIEVEQPPNLFGPSRPRITDAGLAAVAAA